MFSLDTSSCLAVPRQHGSDQSVLISATCIWNRKISGHYNILTAHNYKTLNWVLRNNRTQWHGLKFRKCLIYLWSILSSFYSVQIRDNCTCFMTSKHILYLFFFQIVSRWMIWNKLAAYILKVFYRSLPEKLKRRYTLFHPHGKQTEKQTQHVQYNSLLHCSYALCYTLNSNRYCIARYEFRDLVDQLNEN